MRGQDLPHLLIRGGGRKRLPKFKFSAKFPIGLHVILQIQIKKIRKWLLYYVKNYFNRKSVEVQRWTPLEIMLNGFCLKITRLYVCSTCNGRVSRCCHIESSFTGPPCTYYANLPHTNTNEKLHPILLTCNVISCGWFVAYKYYVTIVEALSENWKLNGI